MAEYWFPDTTVLCNFAVIDELQLLRTYLHDRGRVVEAVAREIGRSAERVPNLANVDRVEWFGDAIRIEKQQDIDGVEVTRVSLFGGTKAEPTKHLGESQTLYVLSNDKRFSGSIWITDDREAYRLGKRRGILTLCTVEVFRALVGHSEISSQEAFEHCVAIQQARPSLFMPPTSARDFE